MASHSLALSLLFAFALPFASCASHPNAKDPGTENKVAETLAAFRHADPDLDRFFNESYGYAVFPKVGKGGFIAGGGGGGGYVYEQGQLVGTVTLRMLTVGAQIGGQDFREIIFFQDQATLEDFKSGNFEFSATVDAVAASSGAARQARFDRGVAVFTLARSGLMAEASVGGQKFDYRPIADS